MFLLVCICLKPVTTIWHDHSQIFACYRVFLFSTHTHEIILTFSVSTSHVRSAPKNNILYPSCQKKTSLPLLNLINNTFGEEAVGFGVQRDRLQ